MDVAPPQIIRFEWSNDSNQYHAVEQLQTRMAEKLRLCLNAGYPSSHTSRNLDSCDSGIRRRHGLKGFIAMGCNILTGNAGRNHQ
jgi:hypothetical protein